MSKIRFSKEEQARLRTLIAVEKVSDKTLVFTQAFKRRAVLLSRQGKTANQIFREAGIDIDLFPAKYFHHVIKRWKKSNLQDGIITPLDLHPSGDFFFVSTFQGTDQNLRGFLFVILIFILDIFAKVILFKFMLKN